VSKDLLVVTADLDAQEVMKAILERCEALEIHPISFDVVRHLGRDPGLFVGAADYSKLMKEKYHKLIIMLDYHGSGCSDGGGKCAATIQKQLDGVTWKSHSLAVIIEPELEEWLWHNEASIQKIFELSDAQLKEFVATFCKKHDCDVRSVTREKPKELLDFICEKVKNRGHLRHKEFGQLASSASLKGWQTSASFRQIVAILQEWFPSEV